jgi:phosphotransferase system IIB component
LEVETIPQALQEKLLEIRKLGGKNKLNKNINAMTENAKSVDSCFKQLKQLLASEEQADNQKRKQYGSAWSTQPSS